MTRLALLLVALAVAHAASAATLSFTLPATHIDGSPLPAGYRRWDVSYARQSPTWLAYRDSRVGDTVLDPFAGAGTTLLVADRLQRHGIGIELNPKYAEMAERRIRDDAPLFAE